MAGWKKIELKGAPFLLKEEGGVCFLHSIGERDYRSKEKREALGEILGLSRVISLKQMHGTKVLDAGEIESGSEGDGLVLCSTHGSGIAVLTADCVPLLMVAPQHLVLLHVGWRGLAGGIVQKGLDIIRNFYGGLKNIKIWFGPHIKQCCYRVGRDMLEVMEMSLSSEAVGYSVRVEGGKMHFSLERCIGWILKKKGVSGDACDSCGYCTFCSGLFPSFRREGEKASRMINLAWRK